MFSADLERYPLMYFQQNIINKENEQQYPNNTSCYILNIKQFAKHVMCITSLNTYIRPMKQVPLETLFYKQRNEKSERLGDFPNFTQKGNGRA